MAPRLCATGDKAADTLLTDDPFGVSIGTPLEGYSAS